MTTLTDKAPYQYSINLDERGEFYADVRHSQEHTVFEIHGFDLIEDGWLRHTTDVDGLQRYLISLQLMTPDEQLVPGNFTR
jgi:hypothetical protein